MTSKGLEERRGERRGIREGTRKEGWKEGLTPKFYYMDTPIMQSWRMQWANLEAASKFPDFYGPTSDNFSII